MLAGSTDGPGPSGRLLQGVAGAAACGAFALLVPDSASAESVSATVLSLLARPPSSTATRAVDIQPVLGTVYIDHTLDRRRSQAANTQGRWNTRLPMLPCVWGRQWTCPSCRKAANFRLRGVAAALVSTHALFLDENTGMAPGERNSACELLPLWTQSWEVTCKESQAPVTQPRRDHVQPHLRALPCCEPLILLCVSRRLRVYFPVQERIQDLGPYGPLLFVAVVAGAELIPLFPTQPLTLASGLLFGPKLARPHRCPSLSCRATLPVLLGAPCVPPLLHG